MWKVEFVLIILCFFVDGLKADDEGNMSVNNMSVITLYSMISWFNSNM